MTPYRERHEQNEYELGSIATAVVEQPVAPAETETVENEPDQDEADDDEAGDDDDDDEDAEATFVCAECGRTFKSEHGLTIHTGRAHTEEPE